MEATLEQQILHKLDELAADIRGARGQLRDFRVVLMGDSEGETEHGRMPRVERQVDGHEARITSLETDRTIYKVYGRVTHYLWALGSALIGIAADRYFEHLFGK